MSEIDIFISSTSFITLDHKKLLRNSTLETPDTLTMRSTLTAQRAWKARKSTTSSLRSSFKNSEHLYGIAQVFSGFPGFSGFAGFCGFF